MSGKERHRRVPLVQRLAIALKHPVRVRALSALLVGDGSATQLSRQFGDVSVADASYHLNVLADECRLIDRVRSRPVRGAVERFFRLKPGVAFAIAPITVDQQGMREISEVLQEAMGRVRKVEEESRHRLQGGSSVGFGAVFGAAAIADGDRP